MEIKKIVVTGGPCGGKSSCMGSMKETFSKLGYTTLVISETATEFITGGVAPWTCGTNAEYQKCQMALQLKKEELFEQAARTMDAENILILCDRGALDNLAYMNEEELGIVLDFLGLDIDNLLGRYDGVIHLETVVKGKPEIYTTANNSARIDTPEEALALDDRAIIAWKAHPNHYVISNEGEFADKIRRAEEAIAEIIGVEI